MARAHHVKRARRAYKDAGIKKGESYWWWRFYRSTHVNRSKVQPRPSQLTGSDFLSQLYAIQEEIEALPADAELISAVEDLAGRLRTLGEEQTDKRDNMPEALQDSETGQLLEARAEACEAGADELEAIDLEFEADGEDDDEETEHAEKVHWDRVLEEVQAISLEID